MNSKTTVLVILDGFGHREQQTYNAIAQADTPTITFLLNTYPHCYLRASGEAVGLPAGSMGNSEVGHLTIGAGRVIIQPVVRINEMIKHHQLLKDSVTESKIDITNVYFISIQNSNSMLV